MKVFKVPPERVLHGATSFSQKPFVTGLLQAGLLQTADRLLVDSLRCCKIAAGMLLDRLLLCWCQAAAEVLKIAGCYNGQPANCCSAATGMLLDCYR